jgi:hypothetical protein
MSDCPGRSKEPPNPINPAWIDDLELRPSEFRVLFRIVRRCGWKGGAPGECWEGLDSMANGCRLSRETVKSAIRELESRDLISVEERNGETKLIKLTIPNENEPC